MYTKILNTFPCSKYFKFLNIPVFQRFQKLLKMPFSSRKPILFLASLFFASIFRFLHPYFLQKIILQKKMQKMVPFIIRRGNKKHVCYFWGVVTTGLRLVMCNAALESDLANRESSYLGQNHSNL